LHSHATRASWELNIITFSSSRLLYFSVEKETRARCR
jgi:hypothetical protein